MILASHIAGVGAAEAAGGVDSRLKPAAHEFEACLIKEFLKPLQQDALFTKEGDKGDDDSGNALLSFGSAALARSISERGGFGIAAKIIEHLEPGKDKVGAGACSEKRGFSENLPQGARRSADEEK
jgi:flagellar protein FlgJ